MSDDKRTPWGDAFAIKPGRNEGDRDIWIDLGPVWQSEQGNFSLTLDVEPLHWRNPNAERRIVITRRQPKQDTAPSDSKPRGGKR